MSKKARGNYVSIEFGKPISQDDLDLLLNNELLTKAFDKQMGVSVSNVENGDVFPLFWGFDSNTFDKLKVGDVRIEILLNGTFDPSNKELAQIRAILGWDSLESKYNDCPPRAYGIFIASANGEFDRPCDFEIIRRRKNSFNVFACNSAEQVDELRSIVGDSDDFLLLNLSDGNDLKTANRYKMLDKLKS